VPQAALITRRDVLNHGAGSDFVGEFDIRTIVVACTAAGSLGAAAFAWRFADDTNTSSPKISQAGPSWTWDAPDPSWLSITFPALAYLEGTSWTVATDGSVTPIGGAPGGLSAVRYDIVGAKIAARSSDFATWAQPRCVPPIISIGEGEKGWLADLLIYDLRSRSGMTPPDAGAGDDNVRARAEAAERNIRAIGASAMRPPGIVDSSPGGGGTGIPSFPRSRSSRGFEDY
jgi:hypothetical protein